MNDLWSTGWIFEASGCTGLQTRLYSSGRMIDGTRRTHASLALRNCSPRARVCVRSCKPSKSINSRPLSRLSPLSVDLPNSVMASAEKRSSFVESSTSGSPPPTGRSQARPRRTTSATTTPRRSRPSRRAVTHLRMSAGITCDVSRSKLSPGP